ncbi:MAG: hypothetical protein GEU73_06750 [Chloroflexi bacterium]|nr:hypothetical protein [Chloroflexota bacterium]
MAIVNEPDVLTSATGLSSNISTPIRLFNAGVALKDERGVASPYLVEALPRLNTDSWIVLPDGRMETTYRLKSNLSWHDGTALAAGDFVFGWRVFTSAAEGRFVVENRIAEIGEHPRASDILVDTWRRLGIDASTSVFASSLINDGQFRASYPSLDSNGTGVSESNVRSLGSGAIPRPENRWTGQNRGGWSHAEYDRLVDLYDTTLDRSQRNQQVVDMMRIVSDEVPWIPFYFNLRVIAYTTALSGPQSAVPGGTRGGNVHEWELM